MTEGVERRAVLDTRQLLEVTELTSVKYFEVSAKLADLPRKLETQYAIGVLQQRHSEGLAQRFKLTATAPDADYVIEVGTFYSLPSEIDVPVGILQEFIERVAVMAAFPYLREGLATSAARLEIEVPILGLLRAGQFKLDPIPDVLPSPVGDVVDT